MDVQKKIDKFYKKLGKAEMCEEVKVISLKRKHFKKELSTSSGFGFQDLKEDPKELVTTLISDGHNLQFFPKSVGNLEVDVVVQKTCEC